MVDQRASGTLSAGKGGFGNGDGDVVHVNFFTVGDTNTLRDG